MRGKVSHRIHFRQMRDAFDDFDMDHGQDKRYEALHGHIRSLREALDEMDGGSKKAQGESPGRRAAREAAGGTTEITGQPTTFSQASDAAREKVNSN